MENGNLWKNENEVIELSKDGNMWCCLCGMDIQEGDCHFASTRDRVVAQFRAMFPQHNEKPVVEQWMLDDCFKWLLEIIKIANHQCYIANPSLVTVIGQGFTSRDDQDLRDLAIDLRHMVEERCISGVPCEIGVTGITQYKYNLLKKMVLEGLSDVAANKVNMIYITDADVDRMIELRTDELDTVETATKETRMAEEIITSENIMNMMQMNPDFLAEELETFSDKFGMLIEGMVETYKHLETCGSEDAKNCYAELKAYLTQLGEECLTPNVGLCITGIGIGCVITSPED